MLFDYTIEGCYGPIYLKSNIKLSDSLFESVLRANTGINGIMLFVDGQGWQAATVGKWRRDAAHRNNYLIIHSIANPKCNRLFVLGSRIFSRGYSNDAMTRYVITMK